MSPSDVIFAFFDLVNTDRQAILTTDLVSPNATWWSNGSDGLATRSGSKSFEEHASSYIHTSSTYKCNERVEILDVITDGNGKFVVELLVTAKGVVGTITAGKTYTGHMVIAITVRDGQIVELREHKDNLAGILFLGKEVVYQEGRARSNTPVPAK